MKHLKELTDLFFDATSDQEYDHISVHRLFTLTNEIHITGEPLEFIYKQLKKYET